MNREIRIEKIKQIEQDKTAVSGLEKILWQDELKSMEVHKIPLQYLVYNKYNGRILSRTKSLEQQGRQIDPTSKEGKGIIEKLLLESHPLRNRKTFNDIKKYGQKVRGIITADGIIIDGNRRALFLNKNKNDYFETIILPVTLEQDPREIEKLEISYQMGEDRKLDYNPIEKYLKTKTSLDHGVDEEELADWMGEPVKKIKEYSNVMDTMENYLTYLEYYGMYTQLDGREDQFISLTKWLNNFNNKGSNKGFDGYTPENVRELEMIAFDYIRVKYKGKEFRILGEGQRDNHFFGNKDIWESFAKKHFEIVDSTDAESPVSDHHNSPNISKALDARDKSFAEQVEQRFEDNLKEHENKLNDQKNKTRPQKLASEALDKISIISNHKNISNDETLEKLDDLSNLTTWILKTENYLPSKMLQKVVRILEGIDLSENRYYDEDLLENLEKIERIIDNLKKQASNEPSSN